VTSTATAPRRNLEEEARSALIRRGYYVAPGRELKVHQVRWEQEVEAWVVLYVYCGQARTAVMLDRPAGGLMVTAAHDGWVAL
jgi:hypothetical protein